MVEEQNRHRQNGAQTNRLSDKIDATRQSFSLTGAIDRFENRHAVIRLDDGQELNWPDRCLPPDAKEGSTIQLIISTEKTIEAEREKIAKNILREIIKSDET